MHNTNKSNAIHKKKQILTTFFFPAVDLANFSHLNLLLILVFYLLLIIKFFYYYLRKRDQKKKKTSSINPLFTVFDNKVFSLFKEFKYYFNGTWFSLPFVSFWKKRNTLIYKHFLKNKKSGARVVALTNHSLLWQKPKPLTICRNFIHPKAQNREGKR